MNKLQRALIISVLMAVVFATAPTASAITTLSVPAASSDPEVITAGPDGALWFTEFGADKIGRVTTGGVFIEYDLLVGSAPLGITLGPDGNLWFTEAGRDRIGRITPAGIITEFVLPPGSTPARIVAGPDGKIWYTLTDRDRIGRLNPAAADSAAIQASLIEFVVPGGGSPFGIVSGPDGKLWFTEITSNEIGSITTAGTINEFSSGAAQQPQDITAGPDGNLWFASAAGSFVGRITTSGVLNVFTGFGTIQTSLRSIVSGPDGNLWSTDFGANRIIRFTPAGFPTEFVLPPGSGPVGITVGADGNLWFAEGAAGKIGILNPSDPASSITFITINNVNVVEGNIGQTNATFTVSLSAVSGNTVQVTFATADGSATAGIDYEATNGTLTFMPGETSKTISVPVFGDLFPEPNETFFVNLSNAFQATIQTPQGQGTITNDDTPIAQLSIDDVSVTEGNSGFVNAVFTVTRSSVTTGTSTVDFVTANGMALAPEDFTSVSGTLTFMPGETTKTISVPVNGDTTPEGNEVFFVSLMNSLGATITDSLGQGTILDDDPPIATISFTQPSYGGTEDCVAIIASVARTGNNAGTTTVHYTTGNGSASELSDYEFTAGTLTFAPGETTKTIPILIAEDSFVEGTETLTLTLSNPMGGAAIGPNAIANIVIIDDVSEPATNPIDDTETFVCQHYHDFLSREPDAPGLAFWVNNIDSCGADAQCREVKRIDTSAAFFLSIELQQTGFLVERAYQASFNRRVLVHEFLPDSQEIDRGVVVGQPGYAALLEANTVAFFDNFVGRAEFVAVFGGLTNAQFVDALNGNTGNALTQQQRDALVDGLNGATETRATVLRKVSENAVFTAQEFNKAFVLMQYFGYLRRDPDEPGFQFWLNKLNSFNGDFHKADMVKAFLSSTEYRNRFGH